MPRTLTLATGFLLTLSVFLASAIAEDETEKDLKKMAGDWVAVSMQLNGKKQPEATIKAVRLTINGDKYNTVVGKEKDEGTLKIDATKSPREMDITSNVGPNKGQAIPCIYELKGNELKVSYAFNGTPRATDFKPGEDGKGVVMLITYKRAPKSRR